MPSRAKSAGADPLGKEMGRSSIPIETNHGTFGYNLPGTNNEGVYMPPTIRRLRKAAALMFLAVLLMPTAASARDDEFLSRLTAEQRAFLDAHPVIRVGGEMEWARSDFTDSVGRHQGIAADYLAILTEKLGVKFEVSVDRTWSELLEAVRAHEIDLLPALWKTSMISKYQGITTLLPTT